MQSLDNVTIAQGGVPDAQACSSRRSAVDVFGARMVLIAALTVGVSLFASGCGSDGASPVGTWGTDDGPQLVLAEDGGLSGTDGCNRLVSTWKEVGDRIDFGTVASTQMACEGVDTWLNGLATGTVEGDTLHVLNVADDEIGTLERN